MPQPDTAFPIDRTPFTPPVYTPCGYIRSVVLTPGTPLAAGRGAMVLAASGTVLLKLAAGGTLPVTGTGAWHRVDDAAVIDADVSGATGASVVVLY